MSDYTIFIILLCVYISGLVLIGLYYNKKQKTSVDFFLADRNLGPLSIGFSSAASWVTAGALLTVTGFSCCLVWVPYGDLWCRILLRYLSLPFL